ncbi:MAG: PAS domain-containing protein [Deltaproteobacteria bacterium]|nr:PAS domain-containing protein [Deltaproteobacteria bacterium]
MAVGSVFGLWAKKVQTEKHISEVMDFIPNPVLILDNSGTIKKKNKAAGKTPGWSKENAQKINKPESHKKNNSSANHTLSKDFADREIFVPSKTGILYDICDRPYSSIHYMEDVTREREIAKNLRRSETMYRTIIDFAGVGIILFRKDHILYYNERLAEFLGITERIITLTDFMNWIDFSESEIRKFFKKSSTKITAPSTFEFSTNDRDRGWRHYQGYGKVIGYENRPAIHFILDDVTQQRELAKIARMNELRLQHEDRLTALGVMAAGIAHELNQPLNTIRVISDTSLFGRDQGWELNEEEIFDGLEMISKQVLRMSDVIHSIRNFAREDRGKFDNINPNDAIKNVFSMIGKQFEAHGIHIEMDLETYLLPIRGNLNALEQVIMNLVVNARQALDGHRQFNKKLWIKSGARFNQFFIEVGDNAGGIPDELRINVFDPFYTTKEPGKGTGLGLSISQSIVTEFKGTIKVYNNDQGGATFFITGPFSGDKS